MPDGQHMLTSMITIYKSNQSVGTDMFRCEAQDIFTHDKAIQQFEVNWYSKFPYKVATNVVAGLVALCLVLGLIIGRVLKKKVWN